MNTKRSSILCATDFSRQAGEAASVAAMLAQRGGEQLLLVHATGTTRAGVSALVRERLEKEAERLRKGGAQVEPVLLHGDRPAKAVLAYLRDQVVSLVVVGGRVKRPVDRWALGSFSEDIAESSPTPTLVVRNPAVFESWDWTKSRLTILLALDVNPSSNVVLRWAKQFQLAGPCDFVGCHVNWRLPTFADSDPAQAVPLNPAALQKRLERDLRKKVRDEMGDEAMPMVVQPFFGDPGPSIVEIAQERKAHLIAIGTHQRHGIHRLAQFSVSRDVLHESALNVVCVPVHAKFDGRDAHIPDFRRVLVATDFSELGNTAVPYACGACAIGGLVRIIHVVSPRAAKRGGGTGASADLRTQLRALIPDETGARCQPPEVDVIVQGDVPAAICAEAERFGADLVCLASHGLGASRALQGSVAKSVLKQIRRPLLIVRRPKD